MPVRRCAFCGVPLDLWGEPGPICLACVTAPQEDGLYGPMIEPEDTEPPTGLPIEED
jgi:hypothetical protein